MPIYTYKCTEPECGAPASDYLMKFSDPTPPCKNCGSYAQEKQLSTNTGHCLMGYGWHKPGMSTKRVGS